MSVQTAITMRWMMREQSEKGGKEGEVEEKENMQKCGQCIHHREMSLFIQWR